MQDAERQLAGGMSVVVFPEGARTLDGKVHAFRRGAYTLAVEFGLPVVPITIDGAFKVMPRTAILAAIKGVGVNAVNAIITEREANGDFKDIYDFVERVNLSACNRGAIENLALAGAFDSFGLSREMFVHPMFDSTWTDLLVKYGQNLQNDKNSLQLSLFGDFEPIETNKPPFPDFTPWDHLARLE